MTVANALGVELDPDKVVDADIVSEEVRQNWRSYTTEWAGRDPFYSISHGMPNLVVASYEHNAEVLHGSGPSGRFSTSYDNGTGTEVFDVFQNLPLLVNLDGAAHKRIRDAIQPAFNAHGIGVKAGFIEDAVERLLDRIEAMGGRFDMMADYGHRLIPEVILGGLFQTTPEQYEAFTALSDEFPKVSAARAPTPEFSRAFEQVVAVADGMLEDDAEPSDDFVGRLVAAYRDGTINRDEFVGQIMGIASGALTTTAATSGNMLWLKSRYPEQFEQVRRDPTLIPSAVEECLRYHPSGMVIIPRFASEQTEIGGTVVYPGMPILPSPPLANHDPARFESPQDFDVRRNPRNLSWGLGVHRCLGILVARKVLHVTLRRFLERFPEVRLVDPDFTPTYHGVFGELLPREIPMQIA